MHKRTKIWASISAVTFATTTGLVGCNAEVEQKTPVASHIAETVTPSLSSDGEGEGAIALAIDLTTNDLAYLTQLALVRGHLFVGHELYMAGHIEHAKTHMKHPKSELYADIVPAFATRGTTGFAQELQDLATAVNEELGTKVVDATYQKLLTLIAITEAAVNEASHTSAEKLKLVASLLQVAGEEYAIAVVDGKMENAHEYQDALGFTTVAQSIISGIDNVDAKTKAASLVESIKPLWPTIIPPSNLDTNAGQIYGVAAKIELLALSL
jgi:hypothetical protein